VRRRRTRPRRSSGPPRERGGLGGGWSVRGHAVMSPWRLAFVSLRWQRVPCLRRVPFAFFPRPVLVSEQARRNDPVNMCGVTGSSAGVRFFHNVAWVCTNHHVCLSFSTIRAKLSQLPVCSTPWRITKSAGAAFLSSLPVNLSGTASMSLVHATLFGAFALESCGALVLPGMQQFSFSASVGVREEYAISAFPGMRATTRSPTHCEPTGKSTPPINVGMLTCLKSLRIPVADFP